MGSLRHCELVLLGLLAALAPRAASAQPEVRQPEVRQPEVRQPQVRFEREFIRVVVKANGIRVEGTYVFANDSPAPLAAPLFYPLPVDSLHPWPTSIGVYSADGEEVEFSRSRPDGVRFRVELPAGGHGSVRVVYEQPSLDGSACYILTTTSAWHRPLERADFEIVVPAGVEIESMAYEADDVVVRENDRVYILTREQFMPAKDLCMRWRIPSER
jgi:hypothetical protein